jgi:hypothetical protein
VRLIRTFALAAIAVGAFTAFLGVTSASALTSLELVVFCKVKEDPCQGPNQFLAKGETKSTNIGKVKLHTSVGNVLCNSVATGTSNETTNLAHGLVTVAWSGCERDKILGGTEACTVTGEDEPYLGLFLLATDHVKYHLVVSEHIEGVTKHGKPKAHVVCGSIINCTYGAPEILFEALLDETNHDTVMDVNQTLEREGGICPEESQWEGKYLLECKDPGGAFTKSCWPKMEPVAL